MQRSLALAASGIALALVASACSPAPAPPSGPATPPATSAPLPSSPAPSSPTTPAEPAAAAKIVGLEGLGELRLGQPVPPGSSWAERGAQASDACRTVSSPDYPGVYAIVTEGKVQRVTVGAHSDVKLADGIGVGATEAEVGKWFAGFRAEPHKYEAAPAKYLTAPGAERGDPALRFEIGQDGKVKFIHVGMMPVLAYVEGCA